MQTTCTSQIDLEIHNLIKTPTYKNINPLLGKESHFVTAVDIQIDFSHSIQMSKWLKKQESFGWENI